MEYGLLTENWMINKVLFFLGYLAVWILVELGVLVYALLAHHDLSIMFAVTGLAAILLGFCGITIMLITPLTEWGEADSILFEKQKLITKK
jgi:hypothetical protein